ncbi:MAG: DVUA0089 family protein [Phycisphaeraceae bacterium]
MVVSLLALPAIAQEKKEEKKDPPRIVMVVPLAVSPGEKVKLTLRGISLDDASAVRIGEGEKKIDAQVKSKGKVGVPDKYDAKTIGDTRIEIEFALPADTPAGRIAVIAVTPAGESRAYELPVIASDQLIDEKEPNDGFKQSQAIELGKTIRGHINSNNEVDVYQFTGKAGQKVTCEALAARLGSAVDPLLTLYDAKGNFVAMQDDADKSRDAILVAKLPSDGVYYLVIQDALDRGEATHPYLLSVSNSPPS